ncbi:MAG: leucine-rich repeat domain-containing protein [Ruminococcus sp.]|nr:leucine-rich repeat domain-containing protein [Ruminococcus sp.]
MRLISVILSVLMIMSAMSVISASADSTASGTTGDCYWRYDADSKMLTISGEGAMADYMIGGVPWSGYEIEYARVENGVTKLSENFLSGAENLQEVDLPTSLVEISKYAFKGTSLTEILIPDNVKTIGEAAFQDCIHVDYVELGNNLETIGYMAFSGTTFSEIYIPRNVSTIIYRAFGTYRSDLKMYYAEGSTAENTVIDFCREAYFYCTPAKLIDLSLAPGKVEYANANFFTTATGYTSSNEAVASVSTGYVTALKKGTATISAYLRDGSEIKGTVTVNSNPSLKVGGKAYKSSTTYNVIKGKSLTVKITGKASSVDNVYSTTSAKVAKVTSKAAASTVLIKGLKKGKATITIKVNGVSYKIKVNVMANPSLKVNGKAYKAKTTYSVKKGKYITVKIKGKDSKVKNVYSTTNKKVAKVTSKITATTVKIKGLKKGTATVIIKVNGAVFKIKVKVKN